jgi:hypothetical protein
VLYEIVPVGVNAPDDARFGESGVDPLRYQPAAAQTPRQPRPDTAASTNEWLTVKARYQAPEGDRSQLITLPLTIGAGRVRHLALASAAAELGLLLRSGSRDTSRWLALGRRVNGLELPGADVESLKELVAIAAGMSR